MKKTKLYQLLLQAQAASARADNTNDWENSRSLGPTLTQERIYGAADLRWAEYWTEYSNRINAGKKCATQQYEDETTGPQGRSNSDDEILYLLRMLSQHGCFRAKDDYPRIKKQLEEKHREWLADMEGRKKSLWPKKKKGR